MIRFLQTLIVLVLALSAHGTPNAADDYRDLMKKWDTISDEQKRLLETTPPQFTPSTQAVNALLKLEALSNIVNRAARKDRCDFGLDRAEGPLLMVPHLATMRGAARTMETLARWHRRQGDHDAAVRTADALYGSAFHLGDDQLLISSLVGQSIFGIADDITDELIEAGAIDPDAAALLLRRLKEADQHDPFRMGDAMEMEKIMMSDWVQAQFQSALQSNPGHAMNEEAMEFFQIIRSIHNEEVTPEDIIKSESMQRYADFMNNVVEAFRIEDEVVATARVQELERQLENGDFGDFASVLAVAPQGALRQKFAGQRMLAERIAMLEDIADGTTDPLEHANAAWWYIRAADAMTSLTEDQRSMPEFWKPIQDDLLLATVIEECEFPFAMQEESIDSDYPVPTVPPWSVGVRLCLEHLISDAEQRIAAGDTAGAVNLLTIVLEVAADLASDIMLVDSIMAQDATESVVELVQPLLDAGSLNVDQRRQLFEAARAIPARDPFGYMNAADVTRRLLVEHVGGVISPEVLGDIPNDPDGVLFATAWCELINQPEQPYGFDWPIETDWSVFDGVLDQTALLDARTRGIESKEAASVGVDVELTPITVISTPSIEERRRSGVELLRSWKRSLAK